MSFAVTDIEKNYGTNLYVTKTNFKIIIEVPKPQST